MTTQIRLSQQFAGAGDRTDLGAKWGSGYGAEKPTYQGFNYLAYAITSNILALAEGVLDWDSAIAYEAGARVSRGGSIYFALKGNTNVDPTTDWAGSAQNWHKGSYAGGTGNYDPSTKAHKAIASITDNTVAGSSSTWNSTAHALLGNNTSLYMERSAGNGVLLFSPSSGVFKLLEVNTTFPDGRSLASAYTFVTSNNFASYLPSASTTVKGIVEMATVTEARAGTDTTRAVTPAGLKGAIDDIVIPTYGSATTTSQGLVELATTSEANAGTDTVRAVTPAGLKSHVTAAIGAIPAVPSASTSTKGIVEMATNTETGTGTDTSRAATPAGVQTHYAQRVVIQTTTPSGVGSVPNGGMIIVV